VLPNRDCRDKPGNDDETVDITMDAITIQVLRNKIASLVDEMHYHFYRSGYSTIIRESRDFSCVILDRDGRLIVAPPMFFHAPVYRHLVGRILEVYGKAGAIHEGDVFVSNHPYEGGLPHVSDMAFIAPVFADGRIVAFSGSIAHKADVGGAVPGSTSATATEMYHEGILLPPVKIWEAGEPQPDIERIILTNSRQPTLMRGDIHAQIAVTQMGAARVKELCERFSAGTVTEAFAAILKGAADELGRAIAKLPEGESSTEGFLDSDGIVVDRPIRLAVTIAIKDGLASFDFSASDPQARGPVNLRPSMVEACVFYCLIGSLGPNLHFNDGMRDVVRLTFAPRTITNADPPSPVSSYQMVNLLLVDVILEALAHFNPRRAMAHSGASSALSIAWSKGRSGQSNMQYEIAGSAYGGGNGHDGATATATHLSNLHTTPIEILESEFPCRITRFDLVPDSGGAGQWRGGLAMQREYQLLENATVIRRFNKTRFPPKGVAGGKDGNRARFVVRVGTPQEFETPASARIDMKAGEHFLLQSAGGGGYGDPARRDLAAIARDLAEGYITHPEGYVSNDDRPREGEDDEENRGGNS
jgi:N-methylhydantoinase B